MVIWHEHYIQAGDPATTGDELATLADHELHEVRRRVGENHQTPSEVLQKLASDEHPEVRAAVGENHMTPQEVLEQLACDEHLDVRYSLTENCNLPLAILSRLAEDENPYVSHRARRTMRMVKPETVPELRPRPYEQGGDSYTMRDIKFR